MEKISRDQLFNNAEDEFLKTPEYVFLYERNKGIWKRHLEKGDELFEDSWSVLTMNQEADHTYILNNKHACQEFVVEHITFRAMWLNTDKNPEKIMGIPDLIEWEDPMLPPHDVQKEMF